MFLIKNISVHQSILLLNSPCLFVVKNKTGIGRQEVGSSDKCEPQKRKNDINYCRNQQKLMLFFERYQRSNKLFELGPMWWLTHRVISDRVHRLLVTLSYFRPDRFVQLLSLIPILILLLYYLVSGCLTSLC